MKEHNTYKEYKPSGVPWLGNVPKHWEALPNKHIFRLKKSLVGKEASNYTLLSLTLRGVIERDMDNPQGKFPTEFDTYQIVDKDDFVFCLFDVEETPRCVGLSEYKGMITGAYTVFKTNDNFNNKFLYYYYLNLDTDKRLKPLYTGLRNTISKEAFASLKTFIPPLEEQALIAEYLDRKNKDIDRAVSISEELIELLKERKQVMIQELVTGKYKIENGELAKREASELKDSGVDWLGDVPKEWDKTPGLSFLIENKRSNSGMKEDIVLSLSYGKIIIRLKENLFGLVPESFETYQIVYPGDIIVRSTDLQNDKVSLRIGLAKDLGIITSAYLNLGVKGNNILSKFIYFYIHSLDITKVLYMFGKGLRQNLSFYDFKRMPFVIPPLDEQKEIVKYIDNEIEKIDKAMELQRMKVERLKEYRASLIDDVVTGKIKVKSEK